MASQADLNINAYSFGDLVNIDTFAHLLDSFYNATGIPNGLVGPNGEVISQAGWTDSCANFHRVHPETQQRCQKSNIKLMQTLQNGQVSGCMCGNGLIDYATPIVVEGKQLATLFLGQVLNEPPDLERFRRQAKRFGFDEESYLDSIRAVPIISSEKLEAHMGHMVEVARLLAISGLAKLRERRLQKSLNETTEKHIQMQDLLDHAPVGIGWSNTDDKVEYVNRRFTELFGYTLDDLPDLDTWYHSAYPDPAYRERVVAPWQKAVAEAHKHDLPAPKLEASVTCKDGHLRRIMIHVSWVGNKRLVNFSDMTEHWLSEQRNRTHDTILEMVAQAKPIDEILHAVVHGIETESPKSLCCILLADSAAKQLHIGASPSLPDYFNKAIDGLDIAMGIGSCGTAAYLGERVVVEDIGHHEYWRAFAALAETAGLQACWSEPIRSSTGQILGTFAIYNRTPAHPSADDIERITFAANIAGVAIESHLTRDSLQTREREFRSLAENAPYNIVRYDAQCRCLYVNRHMLETTGVSQEQFITRTGKFVENEDTRRYDAFLRQVIENGQEVCFDQPIQTPHGNELHQVHIVPEFDDSGQIVSALSIGWDMTERKEMEKKIATREREFRTLAENAPVQIARYDLEHRMIYMNPRLERNFPIPREQILGKRLDQLPGLPFTDRFEAAIHNTLSSGIESILETDIPGKGSEFETHLVSMVAEHDESGAVTGVLAIGQDITERKHMERELERQANFDTLTGLANRRYFLEKAEDEISRSKRYGSDLSLIMFDIDHFKQVNDNHGHHVGDQILRHVAEVTRNSIRNIDLAGRIGGEEFVVLLPQTDLEHAGDAAERLRAAMESEAVRLEDGSHLIVTASLGVVTQHNNADGLDSLLRQADAAMYEAKQCGRNQVCLSSFHLD